MRLSSLNYSDHKDRKNKWKKFRVLILCYLALLACWLVLKITVAYPTTIPLVNPKTGKILNMPGSRFGFEPYFFSNWFSSFSEDLLFFGVGFLGLFLSSNSLRDEKFHIRVSSLANGKHVNKTVEDQLIHEIHKLLSYNKKKETKMTFKKLSTDKKYIYVDVQVTCEVVNLCNDQDVKTNSVIVIDPGPDVDGTKGQIYQLMVIEGGEKTELLDAGVVKFSDLNGARYEKKYVSELSKDGEYNLTVSYETWLPLDPSIDQKNDWYWQRFVIYTENCTFKMINHTNKKLKLVFQYKERKPYGEERLDIYEGSITINSNEQKPLFSQRTFDKEDYLAVRLCTA